MSVNDVAEEDGVDAIGRLRRNAVIDLWVALTCVADEAEREVVGVEQEPDCAGPMNGRRSVD